MEDKIRLDIWLWAVRLLKTRSLAAEACRNGRLLLRGQALKPSHCVRVGETIELRRAGCLFQYQVISLLRKRVSANLASECYNDLTPVEERKKFDERTEALRSLPMAMRGLGRPTKKVRRNMDRIQPSTKGQAESDWAGDDLLW